MATHYSILAWKSPWTEEPGGLQSIGSQNPTQLSEEPYIYILPFYRPGSNDPNRPPEGSVSLHSSLICNQHPCWKLV